MALSYAHGAIQWSSADAVNTTYVVSGLGFQPKALKFTWNGQSSAVDAVTQTTHLQHGIGFATSISDRRSIGAQNQDNTSGSVCTAIYRADCAVALCTATGPASAGLLDISAVGADGFTMIVDQQAGASITVFYEAWGGTDITVAGTLEISEPAATGNQTYTLTGFTATDAKDQVVMFAGCNLTGAAPTVARADTQWMNGVTTGTAAGENECICLHGRNTTNDCSRWAGSTYCIVLNTTVGLSNDVSAKLNAFTTDGFQLNWTSRATTGRKYIALGIKGGNWQAGKTSIDARTTGLTATVTGLGFTPIGVETFTAFITETALGFPIIYIAGGYGIATSLSSRRCFLFQSVDAANPTNISLDIEYDQIGTYYDGTPRYALDINSMDADGFSVINDLGWASLGATNYIGYLAFGNAAVSGAGGPGLGSAITKGRYHRYSSMG